MDDSKIVEIYSAANAIEAYAIANALEEAGIKARVTGEFSGGYPSLLPHQSPCVCVLEEEEARARELIKEWKAGANITPESEEPE